MEDRITESIQGQRVKDLENAKAIVDAAKKKNEQDFLTEFDALKEKYNIDITIMLDENLGNEIWALLIKSPKIIAVLSK